MRINFRRCRESNSWPPDKVKRKRTGRVALYLSSVGPCMVAPSLDRLVAVAIFDNNTLPTLSQSQYIHQSNRPSAWLTCTRNGARLTTPVLKLFKRSTDLTKWSCDKLEILWQPKWFEHPGFWSCGPRREWCSRSSAWSAPPCWRRGHRSWWRECPATPLQTANVNENCLLRPFWNGEGLSQVENNGQSYTWHSGATKGPSVATIMVSWKTASLIIQIRVSGWAGEQQNQ